MSTIRAALGASLALHVALAVVLAAVAFPAAESAVESPPTRVTLLVDPARGTSAASVDPAAPEPAASTVAQTGTAEAPAFPAARRTSVTAQPERRIVSALAAPRAETPAGTARASGDTTARPIAAAETPLARPVARESGSAPDALPAPASLLANDFDGDTAAAASPPAASAVSAPGEITPTIDISPSYGARKPRGDTALPVFPEVLRREGREAVVTVRFVINRSGAVESIEVDRTSGDTSVDVAAVSAVRGYLFEPVDDGSIEEDVGVVTFHFRLRKVF